jgi:hypothetical protein
MKINENELDQFLNDDENTEKVVKGDKSLVERIDKKIIVEDGRQLLI